MAGGKEEDFYAGSKRTGNPFASKAPKNSLDELLDHYFGKAAPVDSMSAYIPEEYNTEHPTGDVDDDSHIDDSWTNSRL